MEPAASSARPARRSGMCSTPRCTLDGIPALSQQPTESNLATVHNNVFTDLLGACKARFYRAKRDAIAANAKLPPLLAHGLCEAQHAGLGRGVVSLPCIAVDAAGRGYVDNAAGLGLACM